MIFLIVPQLHKCFHYSRKIIIIYNENWWWWTDGVYRNQFFAFACAWYVGTFINLFVVCLPVSDGSGWFGGLPWRWGWRGRRWWGRAVSKEAAPSELLRLIVLLFGRGRRTPSPSHPPSSGRLIGPWPACAIYQSHSGDKKSRAPDSLWSLTSWSLLLFSPSVEGDGELLFWTPVPTACWFLSPPFTSGLL